MKTVFERIKNLYGIAKIDTADVLTLAEISAVSGEIMKLNDYLQNIKGLAAVNIFTAPSRASIAKAFENIDKIDRNIVIRLIECIHIYDKTHIQIAFNFKDEYEQTLAALSEYREVV